MSAHSQAMMCARCATIRAIKRRSASWFSLRCRTCGETTRHDPILTADDWRESINEDIRNGSRFYVNPEAAQRQREQNTAALLEWITNCEGSPQ